MTLTERIRRHTDICNARTEGPYLQAHPITGDDCWCHDDEALEEHSRPRPRWLERAGKDLTGAIRTAA